ncbi:MAG: carbamoyl-phosphate synthase large subunit [Bdellovibrionaceae bacterium]|nr:carbamoyl-phosphate synthase large subunit [Pseudobdellovibrionaceae bacterium]
MPKKSNLKKVLILGSGPIVIGQACEFDYSGTQACKAIMKENIDVVLVNSNPATIMTDPEIATKTYIEPLKIEFVEKIIEKERPQAIIPTLGGQTALNLALELHEAGILKKWNVELLGATPDVIKAAEDRELFRSILDKVGAKYPKSYLVRTYEYGLEVATELGYPLILRPNYTLGGGGGGIAYSPEEYRSMIIKALHESPTSEVLVEESIIGWKEYELEVMRDHKGTFVVVCNIENLDPCGVHTGDSITIAPQMTLTDQQYQDMRDEAYKIINLVGVQTGGANIQFAVHPTTGERVVIEMNPRVSRSSALASKATGFPIAKIAALLALGYSMDELKNDITRSTPSSYEPALDYVVTKIPRFAFEKFQGSKDLLTTQMKSVGEVMGIGRTFKESLMKALLSLEFHAEGIPDIAYTSEQLSYPNSQRVWALFQIFRDGKSVEEVQDLTQINPWFLEQIQEIVQFEKHFTKNFKFDESKKEESVQVLLDAKRMGFSDARIAKLCGRKESEILALRHKWGLHPKYSRVDTCAAEFESNTPYLYSSYWSMKSELPAFDKPVAIIGSGPNRIGQGIEFDYSCVRGVKAIQKNGIPVIMMNSNPETVSTDYDTSDLLFFEPLTAECVSEVMWATQAAGFVSQLGGQTPINITKKLLNNGFQLLGSTMRTIDLAEDRGLFSDICKRIGLQIPKSAMVGSYSKALEMQSQVGFPMICRPSFVLGGRRMEVLENPDELKSYFERHKDFISDDKPCLMDQFLDGALEVDVDVVRGKDWIIIGGIIEHIEAAGVHSGDSMGVIPPQRLKDSTCDKIEELSRVLANELEIVGFMNLQMAIKDDVIYVLEANPRSSRSVPFIAKATGIPLIDLGVEAILGKSKKEMQLDKYNWRNISNVCVKGVVFPFKKFSESDSILGPEMKSTGESMGRGSDYSEALMKAFLSSHVKLPSKGEVFFSLREKDKDFLIPIAREMQKMGYQLSATTGTAAYFNENGLECISLKKVHEGRPHCVDHIRKGNVSLVINTTTGRQAIEASFDIRRACIDYSIPCITESDAAVAFLIALKKRNEGSFDVTNL